MTIIDKKPEAITFKDLDCGDVFKKYGEHDCLLKTEICVANEDNCTCNFITLEDGLLGGLMHDDEYVIKVPCKLIVE